MILLLVTYILTYLKQCCKSRDKALIYITLKYCKMIDNGDRWKINLYTVTVTETKTERGRGWFDNY